MTRPLPLDTSTLAHHAARLTVPTYDRAALVPSVVHLSVGSFHRSHQAVFFDDLAEQGVREWGLVGVGLRRPEMREALVAQDGLFTVVSRGAAADTARVIGVIRRYLFAPDHGEGVLESLADPRTRLVTLTVTQNGYFTDPAGRFLAEHQEVLQDLADPEHPTTALGFLVEALRRRRLAGLAPFTVLSCDNMPGNGPMARAAVCAMARLRDPALADWIDAEGAFPGSMVDRITPSTSVEDRDRLAERFGVQDRTPVITEPFSQWVIEDHFCNGRPPLERVGVQFVDDVRPHALLKTRLLNGGHCAIGHLGRLAGHRTTDAVLADPVFRVYVEQLMADEVSPLLPAVDGVDLEEYRETILERLANPSIVDRLSRLCRNGSAKMPAHILSSIAESRALGREHPLLTLAVAGWLRYLGGVDDRGRPLALDDPLADRLLTLAAVGGADPRPVMLRSDLFGDLADDAAFVADVAQALDSIDRYGTRAAVAAYLAGTRSTTTA